MTQTRKHICDTENPQRSCCWQARIAELEVRRAHQQTPEAKAAKAAADAEVDRRFADSFISKGVD